RLPEFRLEQLDMQRNGGQWVPDIMGHARRQTAEQGEVLGTLGLTFEASALGHGIMQRGRACGHAHRKLLVALHDCLFGLLELDHAYLLYLWVFLRVIGRCLWDT